MEESITGRRNKCDYLFSPRDLAAALFQHWRFEEHSPHSRVAHGVVGNTDYEGSVC